MKQKKIWWQMPVLLAALALFLAFLFYADNKYQTPPPYGASGVISLAEEDFERSNPVFLIDGWLLSDARVTDLPTYIGEYSNLSRGDRSVLSHGCADYRLTLRYAGAPKMAAVDFRQLAVDYEIFLDGAKILTGAGNGRLVFLLTPGDHELEVKTVSGMGYYSGMYFPPALGTPEALARINAVQGFAYAAAVLVPLTLTLFTVFVWRGGGRLGLWFGALCGFYALYMLRYFVFLFFAPVARYWFWPQSLAMYGLIFCLTGLSAGASGVSRGVRRRVCAVQLAVTVVLLALTMLIPVFPWADFVHGWLTDFYYLFTLCCTAYSAVCGLRTKGWEGRYTMAGCLLFGAGLAANLLFSNRFEPIRFFWQFEWCGLFLVVLFGVMMVSNSRRILQENELLTNHLEEQVNRRTEEVTALLRERKAFFSDLAHDLKAPVFATQAFIAAIRESGVGVDAELSDYLDQAQAKQQEMARRLQGLSGLNALDRIEEKPVRISLRELLADVDECYRGEAEVRAVQLTVELPAEDAFLTAQQKKMDILFENLIYNALRAMPDGGSIHISAETAAAIVRVCVADSGCGIPPEELPHIFRRFYVGAANRETGTGLGLYIVRSIVEELHGRIRADSVVGEGTVFIMEFPVSHS